MTDQERLEFLDCQLAKIGEHFDHVQLLVTWNDENGTSTIKRGIGNWHARKGMAYDFINQDANEDAAIKIAEQLNSDK